MLKVGSAGDFEDQRFLCGATGPPRFGWV